MNEMSAIARAAGLIYVSDEDPGIRRERHGKGFIYRAPRGSRQIRDARTLARIKKLAVPPAWTDVWICPNERGHIQATGRDARGRKQYRYHASWREHRDEVKYEQLLSFARVLPAIRRRLAEDLRRPGLPREKVLAALVRLLESTLIRVGNDEYVRANQSYGLTTLRDQHVRFFGAKVRFHFRGKSGIERICELRDAQLARVVRRCQDIPGQILFQYLDDDGSRKRVGSGDVNEYLREISGTEFTAKYFRTWGGTLIAMCKLADLPPPETQRETKDAQAEAIAHASHLLGNTKTVCKKFYVHPAILEAHAEGWLSEAAGRVACEGRRWRATGLSPRERALVSVLERAQRSRLPRAA